MEQVLKNVNVDLKTSKQQYSRKDIKAMTLIVLGNMLDYYDFLLFAHLGYAITKFFVPEMESNALHLLGLLMFAMPFLARPIGGYFFGHISDKKNRFTALNQTIKYTSYASIAIALLPTYEFGGIICAVLFFLLRTAQGLSLGGEYNTAGTILMEKYPFRHGLLSSILSASGTVGSLIAFAFAWVYLNGYLPEQSWRVAFVIGGVGAYISYLLRSKLMANQTIKQEKSSTAQLPTKFKLHPFMTTLMIGALVGLLNWIPMVYSNFYLTKILNYDINIGLMASLIALIGYIILNPIFGIIADKYTPQAVMLIAAICAIPACSIGYLLIQEGNLYGQWVLITVASAFGAPIHVVMHRLFPKEIRSRNINTAFMAGTSIGGLTPFIAGYFANNYNFNYVPIIMVAFFSIIIVIDFNKRFYSKAN